MKRRRKGKPVDIEVLPSPARMLQAGVDEATLQELVRQKVAEILTAREDFIFEPFFRGRQVSFAIRRLQTVPDTKKWTVHYERYGCLSCHKSELPHASCGVCAACRKRLHKELQGIVRELIKESDGQESNAVGRALLGLQKPEAT